MYSKLPEQFLSEKCCTTSPSVALSIDQDNRRQTLPEEVVQAANLGLRVFPVNRLAKLTGNPELLIGEATCDRSRLEDMAAEFGPGCEWRVAADSSLCILRIAGQQGWNSISAISEFSQEECLALQAYRGDTVWAFFRRPKGLVLRASAKGLATGVSVLSDDDSCPVPALNEHNPDISAAPYWLRELAFEAPDPPPAKVVPLPAFTPRSIQCRRPSPQFVKLNRDTRYSKPNRGPACRRSGYCISRRR